MSLFLNLLLGHMVGDFVLQPGSLVAAKRRGAPGLLLHAALVGAATAIVMFAQIRTYWLAVLAAVALHIAVELITISARFNTSSRGLFVFVLDQTLHLLSLSVLASMWLDGSAASVATFGTQLNDAGLAALAGLVTVVFLGAILAFETVNAVIPAEDGNAAILGFDGNRLLGMVERGTALFAAILVHPAAAIVPFLPRVIHSLTVPPQRRARRLIEASSGLILCAVTYALIASVAIVTS